MDLTIEKRYWVVKDDVLSAFWVDTRRSLFYDEKMIADSNQHTVEVKLSNELGYERLAMDCSASFAKIF